jgi:myo-inositol-1(or 4)-monophosphatase
MPLRNDNLAARSPVASGAPLTAGAAAELLASAVVEAGRLALEMARTGYKHWTKDNRSPVSDVDLALDRHLRERLSAAAPDYGWLSEETADAPTRLDCRRVWVVDPIDGTRAFIAGLPDWSVVAALVENGRPIAGALFAPATDELFMAAASHGARKNGASIRASARSTLDQARVSGPRNHVERLAEAAAIDAIPRIHSLALRLARVASGELDAALAGSHSHDWDLAAADLLIHEAGGVLSDLAGAAPVYNRPEPVHGALAAAGGALHPLLLAALGPGTTKPATNPATRSPKP